MFRFQVFLLSFSNQIYFRMNVYAEFRTNRSPHCIRKRKDMRPMSTPAPMSRATPMAGTAL